MKAVSWALHQQQEWTESGYSKFLLRKEKTDSLELGLHYSTVGSTENIQQHNYQEQQKSKNKNKSASKL